MPSLSIKTAEFFAAIRQLLPKRLTTTVKSGTLYVGKSGEEAIFSRQGSQIRCPIIHGDWEGFAAVNIGIVAAFLKAPPTRESISLHYQSGRLKIDTLSMSAIWVSAPDWIATQAADAHLMDVEAPPPLRYCPQCGKRKGAPVEPTAREWPAGLPVAGRLTGNHANTVCTACAHRWIELQVGSSRPPA